MCGGTLAAGVLLSLGISRFRSIPACAGEPYATELNNASNKVYPRVCGGTAVAKCLSEPFTGLSPRVRGNQRPGTSAVAWARSIPACAGGTMLIIGGVALVLGLSPRVRGNRYETGQDVPHLRSIPACAGEPRADAGILNGNRVYPRVCGGTARKGPSPGADAGLSPRVRGNPEVLQPHHVGEGSIPACAGEPYSDTISPSRQTVYPRVCGGTRRLASAGSRGNGLSPRVRGNLDNP